MKHLPLGLLLLISTIASIAQNTASDAYLTVAYLGYVNGQYVVKIDNKQPGCNPDIAFTYSNFTVTNVTPNPKNTILFNQINGASTTIYFTGDYHPNATFSVLDLTVCQWQGSLPSILTIVMNSVLPVTLTGFSAMQSEEGTKLAWSTDIESNNKEFIIQASVDQTVWVDVATVSSHWKNGTSSQPHTYAYILSNNYALLSGLKESYAGSELLFGILIIFSIFMVVGRTKVGKVLVIVLMTIVLFSCKKTTIRNAHSNYSLFRLKQVDLDGKVTYSKIVQI